MSSTPIASERPSILTLDQIEPTTPVGGKAQGLAQLQGMGLAVPSAFVIKNASTELWPADLAEHYAQIGSGKVAVRSSALSEDGDDSSFAGQYETVLNVEGIDQLRDAIAQCVESLHSVHATAYQQEHREFLETTMCVLVQSMVQARAAGVLFSADPVSGRHDRMVIDAVPGLGEALVSGEKTPDHFELQPDNSICLRELADPEPESKAAITDDEVQLIADGARKAVAHLGHHLDMEWAIDSKGALQWLQARPITTLGLDLNDGQTPIPNDQVVTRCNVGEMMPGPVCPLTFSVQGRAIEHGMQYMHVCYASRPEITQDWTQINSFYGHMFINMSGGLEASRHVSFTTAESMGRSMCGRTIPELQPPANPKALPLRWLGSIKFVRFCLQAPKYTAEFESRFRHFRISFTDDSLSMVEEMERKFPWLCETNQVHLRTSAYSGFMEGVVQGIVTGRDKEATEEQLAASQAEAARLLAGASHVESAVMVEQLDEVTDLLAADTEQAEQFRAATPADALKWLNSEEAGATGLRYQDFISRHGHRGYRELCVRSKAWRDDPETLVQTIQASLLSRLNESYKPKQRPIINYDGLSRALRFLLPRAHHAIRLREQTKSILVQATYTLQCGYRHLGELLTREGKLPDADLVFFLSRDELSVFCRDPSPATVQLMEKRRRTLAFQEKLEFEDVHVGGAVPSSRQLQHSGKDGEYIGRPVSPGVVEGPARVATTLEQAAELQPGEILVSHITDIGWTPYFSLIAGLATDVGSAVSHGAVIAREYGLPAIVNLRIATKVIHTGDTVRLDADKGILTVLNAVNE